MWNIEDIRKECELFMSKVSEDHKKNCSNSLNEIDIIISKKMTKRKGMFEFENTREGIKPTKIKISQNLLECYSDEDIKDVIHHELIHMIVMTYLNKNIGHNEDFKRMCRLYGVSDDTYFTAKPIRDIPIEVSRYSLICAECDNVYHYTRLTESSKNKKVRGCVCGECKSKLVLVDHKENTAIIKWGFGTKKIGINQLEEYDYNIKI